MTPKPPTQDRDATKYRFGQDFTYQNCKYAWRRQPYPNKLVVGTVDDAIGKGFNIIDVKTKKTILKNDEARAVINTVWKDLKKTIYYDRAYGKGLGVFYLIEKEGVPNEELVLWRSYDPSHYYAFYDKFGIASKYVVTDFVGGVDAQSFMSEIIDEDLLRSYELIIREDEEKGEGLSVLEPVWDTLFSLSMLDEQGTYYAIRYGAGIRYMKIPEAKFLDTAFMSKIMAMLKGAIGSNGVYALPYQTIGGVREEFEISSEHAVQINFTQLRDMILGSLSAQTGVPLEIWLGALLGLRSSEKNEDRYFDYMQGIQEDYRDFFKWVVYTLNDLFIWFTDGLLIDIEYIGRDTLSKDELVDQVGKKIDIASKAGFNVPKEWLAGILEIPLEDKEIDPLGINKAAKDKEDKEDQEEVEDTKEDDEEEI